MRMPRNYQTTQCLTALLGDRNKTLLRLPGLNVVERMVPNPKTDLSEAAIRRGSGRR
jgi:hypothetical protein